jgi:hypothetical protein
MFRNAYFILLSFPGQHFLLFLFNLLCDNCLVIFFLFFFVFAALFMPILFALYL